MSPGGHDREYPPSGDFTLPSGRFDYIHRYMRYTQMPGALPSAVSGVPGHVVLSTAVEEAATGAPKPKPKPDKSPSRQPWPNSIPGSVVLKPDLPAR